jgi:hypothetical protein
VHADHAALLLKTDAAIIAAVTPARIRSPPETQALRHMVT